MEIIHFIIETKQPSNYTYSEMGRERQTLCSVSQKDVQNSCLDISFPLEGKGVSEKQDGITGMMRWEGCSPQRSSRVSVGCGRSWLKSWDQQDPEEFKGKHAAAKTCPCKADKTF